MRRLFLLTAAAVLLAAFTVGCKKDEGQKGGTTPAPTGKQKLESPDRPKLPDKPKGAG
jgi:hypothetical protein